MPRATDSTSRPKPRTAPNKQQKLPSNPNDASKGRSPVEEAQRAQANDQTRSRCHAALQPPEASRSSNNTDQLNTENNKMIPPPPTSSATNNNQLARPTATAAQAKAAKSLKQQKKKLSQQMVLLAQIEGASGSSRKQNHCEIEKRRRDKMNHYIMELASMIPSFSKQHASASKYDKLTVLRMAVQHVRSLRSSLCSFSSFHLRPSFLSSGNLLKNLILQMASQEAQDNLFMVVSCDRGKVLFVSQSSKDILNQNQSDLVGQCLFDLLHKDDVSKVKEQISYFNLMPKELLIDSKTLQPILTTSSLSAASSLSLSSPSPSLAALASPRSSQLDSQQQQRCTGSPTRNLSSMGQPGSGGRNSFTSHHMSSPVNQYHNANNSTPQPGARRSFFCRMKSGRSSSQHLSNQDLSKLAPAGQQPSAPPASPKPAARSRDFKEAPVAPAAAGDGSSGQSINQVKSSSEAQDQVKTQQKLGNSSSSEENSPTTSTSSSSSKSSTTTLTTTDEYETEPTGAADISSQPPEANKRSGTSSCAREPLILTASDKVSNKSDSFAAKKLAPPHSSNKPFNSSSSSSPRQKHLRYIVMHCTGYLKAITLRNDEFDNDDLDEEEDFDKYEQQFGGEDGQSTRDNCASQNNQDNTENNCMRTVNCLVAVCRRSPMDRDLKPDRPLTFTCRYSMEGKFVFVDQRTTVALGYTPQQLLGTSHYAYCHKDSVNTFKECHRQSILKSEPVSSDIYQFKRANGQHLWLQTSLKSFRNPWTKFIDYIVANHTTAEGNAEAHYNEGCVPTKFNQDMTSARSMAGAGPGGTCASGGVILNGINGEVNSSSNGSQSSESSSPASSLSLSSNMDSKKSSSSPSSSSIGSSYSMDSYNSGGSIQALLNQIDKIKSGNGLNKHALDINKLADHHHHHHHHHHRSSVGSRSSARKSNEDSGNYSDPRSCSSLSSQNSGNVSSNSAASNSEFGQRAPGSTPQSGRANNNPGASLASDRTNDRQQQQFSNQIARADDEVGKRSMSQQNNGPIYYQQSAADAAGKTVSVAPPADNFQSQQTSVNLPTNNYSSGQAQAGMTSNQEQQRHTTGKAARNSTTAKSHQRHNYNNQYHQYHKTQTNKASNFHSTSSSSDTGNESASNNGSGPSWAGSSGQLSYVNRSSDNQQSSSSGRESIGDSSSSQLNNKQQTVIAGHRQTSQICGVPSMQARSCQGTVIAKTMQHREEQRQIQQQQATYMAQMQTVTNNQQLVHHHHQQQQQQQIPMQTNELEERLEASDNYQNHQYQTGGIYEMCQHNQMHLVPQEQQQSQAQQQMVWSNASGQQQGAYSTDDTHLGLMDMNVQGLTTTGQPMQQQQVVVHCSQCANHKCFANQPHAQAYQPIQQQQQYLAPPMMVSSSNTDLNSINLTSLAVDGDLDEDQLLEYLAGYEPEAQMYQPVALAPMNEPMASIQQQQQQQQDNIYHNQQYNVYR